MWFYIFLFCLINLAPVISKLSTFHTFCINWCKMSSITWKLTRWWFLIYFIFTPIWGYDPIWLIFFKWVVQPPTSWGMKSIFLGVNFEIAVAVLLIATWPKLWLQDSSSWTLWVSEELRKPPNNIPMLMFVPLWDYHNGWRHFFNLLYSYVFCWWVSFAGK